MAEIIVYDAVILIVPPGEPWPIHLAAKIELLAKREMRLNMPRAVDLNMKRKLEIIEEPV